MSFYKKITDDSPISIDSARLCGLPLTQAASVDVKRETVNWGIDMLEVPQFWKFTQGKDIKVAVLDTGVAYQHTDLRDAVVEAIDFTNSPSGPSDQHGHGTHICGIIASRINAVGVVGVAPLSKIYSAKVVNAEGYGEVDMLVKGMEWAIEREVDIISISLSFKNITKEVTEAMDAVIEKAVKKNIHIVAAAGNWGAAPQSVGYPACHRDVISVGAINRSTKITSYSTRGERVDIVAPGDDILSCYPPNGFAKMSGTSMAVPFVVGVMALMMAKHRTDDEPQKTVDEMRERLKRSAIDLGLVGQDSEYGFGLIDVDRLLEVSQYEQNRLTFDAEHLARQIQLMNRDKDT